jgi:hypothetical protein
MTGRSLAERSGPRETPKFTDSHDGLSGTRNQSGGARLATIETNMAAILAAVARSGGQRGVTA